MNSWKWPAAKSLRRALVGGLYVLLHSLLISGGSIVAILAQLLPDSFFEQYLAATEYHAAAIRVSLSVLGIGLIFLDIFWIRVNRLTQELRKSSSQANEEFGKLRTRISNLDGHVRKHLEPQKLVFLPEGEYIWQTAMEALERAVPGSEIWDTTSFWASGEEYAYEKKLVELLPTLREGDLNQVCCVRLVCESNPQSKVITEFLRCMLHEGADTQGRYRELRTEITKGPVHILHYPFILPLDLFLLKVNTWAIVAGGIKIRLLEHAQETGRKYSRGFWSETDDINQEGFASAFRNSFSNVLEELARKHMKSDGSTCHICSDFITPRTSEISLWPRNKAGKLL